ncbi:hypothetical protein MKX01_024003 [Papaver californicum]|nr:hypothetical protein MKX01_024003 [Papaver californicum]
MKLSPKKFCRSLSAKLTNLGGARGNAKSKVENNGTDNVNGGGEVEWELRPGGMLVQKRVANGSSSSNGGELITIRVVSSTFSRWRDISVESTSTFGELKMVLSMVTNLEAREQRLLYRGKEREDTEYLHMVGVKDNDKVLMLEDPAIKHTKSISTISRNLSSTREISNQAIRNNPLARSIRV